MPARRGTKSALANASKQDARAFGRSLTDFGELNNSEQILVDAARAGKTASFDGDIPQSEEERKLRTIRADVVRFFALGGDRDNPLHEHGLRIEGAIIEGDIDLEGCAVEAILVFKRCELSGKFKLNMARTFTIALPESRCIEIDADGAIIKGNLYLSQGFACAGPVHLLDAKVTGALDLRFGTFEGCDNEGAALSCDRGSIGGDLFLQNFTAKSGVVRFVNAKVGGNAEAEHAQFNGRDDMGNAFVCSGIQVGGNFFLRNGVVTKDGGGAVLLMDAKIAGALVVTSATFEGCDKDGAALSCDRASIGGNLFLQNLIVKSGGVRFANVKVGGDVQAQHAHFNGRDKVGNALFCAGIQVGANLFLRGLRVPNGGVLLRAAAVRGNLECQGAHFLGASDDGYVLNCESVHVGRNLFLNEVVADGSVSLFNASINAEVEFDKAQFGTYPPKPETDYQAVTTNRRQSAPVLNMERATVGGTLWIGRSGSEAAFHCGVRLTAGKIARIVDRIDGTTQKRTPDRSPAAGGVNPAFLALDGLTYDRFGERTDRGAPARIAFLRLQSENDLGKEFKPQPWVQMVKVLRDSGDTDAAREVAIAFETQRRQAGTIKNPVASALHWLYGKSVSYGYRPMRLFYTWVGIWALCSLVYAVAAAEGWMAPTQPSYFQNAAYRECRPQNGGSWTNCQKLAAAEYTAFAPALYSLDLILPVVDLQQDKDWAPIIEKGPGSRFNLGVFTRWAMWFEILFGWISSLTFVAILSGLTKKLE